MTCSRRAIDRVMSDLRCTIVVVVVSVNTTENTRARPRDRLRTRRLTRSSLARLRVSRSTKKARHRRATLNTVVVVTIQTLLKVLVQNHRLRCDDKFRFDSNRIVQLPSTVAVF